MTDSSDPYAPSRAKPVRETRTLGELARIPAIVLDCLAALHYLGAALIRAWWLVAEPPGGSAAVSGLALTVASIFGGFATCALVSAAAQWRRWRYRWLIQWTFGLVAVVVFLATYLGFLFENLRGAEHLFR